MSHARSLHGRGRDEGRNFRRSERTPPLRSLRPPPPPAGGGLTDTAGVRRELRAAPGGDVTAPAGLGCSGSHGGGGGGGGGARRAKAATAGLDGGWGSSRCRASCPTATGEPGGPRPPGAGRWETRGRGGGARGQPAPGAGRLQLHCEPRGPARGQRLRAGSLPARTALGARGRAPPPVVLPRACPPFEGRRYGQCVIDC